MTWRPPPRPPWVAAINRGEVPPIAEEAGAPLDSDSLIAEAGGLGESRDALDRYLHAVEDEANLTVLGRWMTRRFLLRLLGGQRKLRTYTAEDPGVTAEPIVEPLIVTGAPRTGTTILHALLAEDPAHRAPLGWELLHPVPPPDPATAATDPRIAIADRELRLPALVAADLDAIHEYSGRMTKECLSAMSFAFRSEELTSRTRVPSYASWLETCDMAPAYTAHRLVLQVLQRRSPPRRWALKSPVHLHNLPALQRAYPDARIVITHRDPLTVLPSVTSLIATLRWAHSDAVDFAEIGRYHAHLYHRDLDGLVGAALDPGRFHHVRYADFMVDPLATVRGIYDHFGWTLDATAERRMAAHLAARPQGRLGAHEYHFEDLGLDRATERARFARYQAMFSIPDE